MIKTPLRYPGGKSRAVNFLAQYLPENFREYREYREPFVGGGSFFIYLKQKYPHLKIWINDLNPEVFLFWKVVQNDLDNLIIKIKEFKEKYSEGKLLFQELVNLEVEQLSELERATRFFILNRITFSGTVESGGFSQGAFDQRFTDSSLERLLKLAPILENVTITNLDYNEVIKKSGKQVFIFLDPPYYSATNSRLYGKRGKLHLDFDHQKFAENMRECQHQFMITYDNCLEIKNNFLQFNCYEWELQYGMNNFRQGKADKGKELLICNYQINTSEPQQLSLL
jgi:DNA adenine methylase